MLWACQWLRMFHNIGEIGTRLICIADCHQNHANNGFELALAFVEREIERGTPFVLVLLGDIFDMLFGGVPYSIAPHKAHIARLENIAAQRKVLYFEGNHDFNLAPIFHHVQIFARNVQPVFATIGGVPISFAHGDIAMPFMYNLYTAIVRNPHLLRFLGAIDVCLGGRIFAIVRSVLCKNSLQSYVGYKEQIFSHKRQFYVPLPCQYAIEGHFHLGEIAAMDENARFYIALYAFSCISHAFIVESFQHIVSIYCPII